eukprot:720768-Pyramimonas_sp.AAC.1
MPCCEHQWASSLGEQWASSNKQWRAVSSREISDRQGGISGQAAGKQSSISGQSTDTTDQA